MQKNEKIVIIDCGNRAADGKLFDPAALSKISHTLLPLHELAVELKKHGIDCITPDEFLASPEKFRDKEALLISHLTTERTEDIIDAGAVPHILLCQESPFIATRFYVNFRGISHKFRHTIAFGGMRKMAHRSTNFHDMYFPVAKIEMKSAQIPFEDRKLSGLVAVNKTARSWKTPILRLLYGKTVDVIYKRRRDLLEAFAKGEGVDIFGAGWSESDSIDIRNAARGDVPFGTKDKVLKDYKFILSFENTIFPGYITEKILDAFMIGAVPIYLGAPDIEKYVPKNTFIDARDFKTYDELLSYIKGMKEGEFNEYRGRIERFLQSDDFKKFSSKHFVESTIALIK